MEADDGESSGMLQMLANDEDGITQVGEEDDARSTQEPGLASRQDDGSSAADSTHQAKLGPPPPTVSVPAPAALACQHCGRGFAKRNGGMLSHIRACATKHGGTEGAVQNTGLSPPRVHTSADVKDLDVMLA